MTDWQECKLSDVAEVQTGPFGSQLHLRDYKFMGTPIVTVEHIGDNRIIHSDLPFVGEEDRTRLIKYSLKTGDVIFSRVGSVDRCAYIHESENGWMFSGRLLRVRSNQEKVDSRFLSFYFSQESFKETIRMIAVGATMPSINTEILSNVEILLPPSPNSAPSPPSFPAWMIKLTFYTARIKPSKVLPPPSGAKCSSQTQTQIGRRGSWEISV